MNTRINKILYLGFVLLGCYQVFFTKDLVQSAASLGIGLAFDPFNPEQKWNDRPSWQKLTLIVHLSIVFGLLFIQLFDWLTR
jgi:protein-S-isoprenylcysteine O-methyltransferase Ste14